MIDNKTVEILTKNNPFLITGITDSNIGIDFDVESASTGDIVCITPLYDELIRRFGSYENAKKIYQFARSLIVEAQYSNYGIGESVPYLNFTVYLEQDIVDEGVLTPYVESWIPGKKYYIGDVVYYSIDGIVKTYVLFNATDYDIIEVTKDIYVANSGDNRYYIEDNKYYFKKYYFTGYYDERTRLTFFDNINSDGKIITGLTDDEEPAIVLTHWKENVDYVDSKYSYEDTALTQSVTESMLNNVMRKKSDIDASGNTLPFILHYNDIINPSTGRKIGRELDTTNTETYYMCGYTNVTYSADGDILCDVLDSVKFYNPDTSVTTESKVFDISNSNNTPILAGDDEITSNYTMIEFTYYIGATLEKLLGGDWVRKEGTGVKYVENRTFTKQNGIFNIEVGNREYEELELPYITVNGNTGDYGNNNLDILVSQREVNYSNIELTDRQVRENFFLSAHTFKDETTMGVQNFNEDIDVEIERGIAESFQKHNMLGEICTMQDLENYKNGKYLDKK